MMRIEHIAVWTNDIEHLSQFYVKYFNGIRGNKYVNPNKEFESYFISFDSGCRLEIMKMKGVPETKNDAMKQFSGLIHFAYDLGTKEAVMEKTSQLASDGYQIIDGPRTTGDGYFESVVLDPDNNRVEMTCLA